MKSLGFGSLALFIIFTESAFGQSEMTREETFAYVGKNLAEFGEEAQAFQAKFATADKGYLEQKFEEWVGEAEELRRSLTTNKYVRVSGFSITIPWGVTFEFEFPEAEATGEP